MEVVLSNLLLLQHREPFVGDLDASGVEARVQLGMDLEAGASPGGTDEVDDHFVAGQRPTTPVHGDVGEEPVLDLVPPRRGWREVANGDLDVLLVGEAGKLALPKADPGAVGTPAVGADHQTGGGGINLDCRPLPEKKNILNGERRRVVILANRDTSGVPRVVVPPASIALLSAL